MPEEVANKGKTFDEVYETQIKPQLKSMEQNRVALHKKVIFINIVVAITLVLIFVGGYFYLNSHTTMSSKDMENYLQMALTACIGIPLWIWSAQNNKIKILAKTKILVPITSLLGNITWTKKRILSLDTVKKMGFYYGSSNDEPDDSFIGSIDNSNVAIQETKFTHQESSGKSSHTVIDFEGILLAIVLDKQFTGKTVVKLNRGKVLGFEQTQKVTNLEPVTLEDVNFNKEYMVYSSDQIEARYILNPALMEKLKEVQHSFGAEDMEFAFYNGNLLILLRTNRNMFEVGDLGTSFLDHKCMYKEAYEELLSISK